MNLDSFGPPAVTASSNAQTGMRTEARALLALGWVPSRQEAGLIYALQADVPPVMSAMAWSVMREILIEHGK